MLCLILQLVLDAQTIRLPNLPVDTARASSDSQRLDQIYEVCVCPSGKLVLSRAAVVSTCSESQECWSPTFMCCNMLVWELVLDNVLITILRLGETNTIEEHWFYNSKAHCCHGNKYWTVFTVWCYFMYLASTASPVFTRSPVFVSVFLLLN